VYVQEELTKRNSAGLAKYHPQSCIEYIFRLEVAHQSNKPERAKLFTPSMYVGYQNPEIVSYMKKKGKTYSLDGRKEEQKPTLAQGIPSTTSNTRLRRSLSSVSYAFVNNGGDSPTNASHKTAGSRSTQDMDEDTGSEIEFFDAVDDSIIDFNANAESMLLLAHSQGHNLTGGNRHRRHSLPDSDDEDDDAPVGQRPKVAPKQRAGSMNDVLLASSSEDSEDDRDKGNDLFMNKPRSVDYKSLSLNEDLEGDGDADGDNDDDFDEDFKKMQLTRTSMFVKSPVAARSSEGGAAAHNVNARAFNFNSVNAEKPVQTTSPPPVAPTVAVGPTSEPDIVLGVLEVDDMVRLSLETKRLHVPELTSLIEIFCRDDQDSGKEELYMRSLCCH
jgi:hypothetical protein